MPSLAFQAVPSGPPPHISSQGLHTNHPGITFVLPVLPHCSQVRGGFTSRIIPGGNNGLSVFYAFVFAHVWTLVCTRRMYAASTGTEPKFLGLYAKHEVNSLIPAQSN